MDTGVQKRKRVLEFDILRILACFSVVMLHSAAQFWYLLDVRTFDWIVANVYDAMFRFGVPVFIMISGALFLDPGRQIRLKELYTRNILRLATAYVFWAAVYRISELWISGNRDFSVRTILQGIAEGKYHLWFLPVMIGIYMLVPILRTWLHNAPKRQIEYFLLLFLTVEIGKNTVISLGRPYLLVKLAELLPVEMAQSNLGYFVLGYYLVHVGLEKKYHKWVYAGGIAGLICSGVCSTAVSWAEGVRNSAIFDSNSLFSCMATAALFLFVTEHFKGLTLKARPERWLRRLSDDTFGIYLVHLMILERLSGIGINAGMCSNIVAIPLVAAICFAASLLVTALLKKIPVLRRYIC